MATGRASGRSGGEEAARKASESNMTPVDPGPPERRRFQGPAFQRIRTDWANEDQSVVARMRTAIDRRLDEQFYDIYRILNQVWDIVREPLLDEDGKPKRDLQGLVMWKSDEYGRWVEDWTRLTIRQREDIMYSITTNLVIWEGQVADAWAESMYARGRWEESHAFHFDEGISKRSTDAEKTQYAQKSAADERYFAIFMTAYSRKAEALVKSMERLSFRMERSLRS